jgi:hypothetical protein
MKIMRNLCAAVIVITLGLTLAGCGKSVSGVYKDSSGMVSVEFKSGGVATVNTTIGGSQDGTYTISGNKVSVTAGGQNMQMTLNDDGTLDSGQPLGVFKKQ